MTLPSLQQRARFFHGFCLDAPFLPTGDKHSCVVHAPPWNQLRISFSSESGNGHIEPHERISCVYAVYRARILRTKRQLGARRAAVDRPRLR